MLFGAVDDGCVAKGRVLRFQWNGVAPFEKDVFDVILDGQATRAFGVVPGEIDAGKSGAGPVLGDFIMLEEDVAKVIGVAFVDVFYAEVVNNYAEEDWAPLVAPEAWGGWTLVVTCIVQALFKEFVGKHA